MSLLGQLTVGILGNMSGLSDTFKSAKSEVQKFGDSIQNQGRNIGEFGSSLTTMITVPLAAIATTSLKAAIDFESAFAGVRKTVDATEKEFAVLKKGFRDMAKEIPVAATEIANVGEAAGQLGIKTENILGFTRTMVDLGVATNLSSDQAATALARLANITQMPQSEFDRLGSTIVALGNSLATTESEIVEMGLRLAGAGKQVGMSEAQILSFAGALSSVGIEAEAGGSAFSKVMIEMQLAAEKGGKGLDNFAKVAGMSASEFKQAYQEDAAGAMIAFIEGLATAEERGLSAIGILDEMGITEVRLRDSLLRAAGASDVFSEALDTGTTAWEENIALTNEANERYKTTESQLKIFWNRIKDIGITIGDILIPALLQMLDFLTPIIEIVTKLVEWFAQLNPAIQLATIAVLAIAAAVGPFLVMLGMLITNVGAVVSSFGALGGVMGIITGPIGIAIGVIAGLIAVGVLLYQNWETVKAKAIEVFGYFTPLFDSTRAAFQTLKDSVEPIMESLKTLFQSLMPILELLGAVVGVTLVTAFGLALVVFNAVASAIGLLIQAVINIADAVANTVNFVVALLTGDFVGAWEYLKLAGQGILDFFINAMTAIENFIPTFIQSIIDFFHGLYMTLVGNSIVPDMVNAIVDWFKNMFKWVIDIVKNIVNGVTESFNLMKNNIQAALELAKTIISTILEFWKSTFINVLSFLKALVSGDFEGMKNAIKNQMENIKTTITTIWNAIKIFVATVLGNILTTVGNIFGDMVTKVKEKMTDIKTGITEGFTNALTAIGDMATKFYNAGANIVSSIADGIKSAIGKVTDAMATVAQKARDFLPFSPAKEGPLKDLNKLDFGGPISDSIKKAMPGVQAMMADLVTLPDVSGVRIPSTNNGDSSVNTKLGGITQHIVIQSHEPTSPSENARKMKQAAQQLAMEWGV